LFADATQNTRAVLRKLDKIISFPEEAALLLREYEHCLFQGVSVSTLLAGITHVLCQKSRPQERLMKNSERDYRLFHKLVSHFYLVSEIELAPAAAEAVSVPAKLPHASLPAWLPASQQRLSEKVIFFLQN
jgi:hypothetical protein